MSLIVTTAGGLVTARGNGLTWAAAQVRSLVSRGYAAFVTRDPVTVELQRRDGEWAAVTSVYGHVAWVRDLVAVLNETEEVE